MSNLFLILQDIVLIYDSYLSINNINKWAFIGMKTKTAVV